MTFTSSHLDFFLFFWEFFPATSKSHWRTPAKNLEQTKMKILKMWAHVISLYKPCQTDLKDEACILETVRPEVKIRLSINRQKKNWLAVLSNLQRSLERSMVSEEDNLTEKKRH